MMMVVLWGMHAKTGAVTSVVGGGGASGSRDTWAGQGEEVLKAYGAAEEVVMIRLGARFRPCRER